MTDSPAAANNSTPAKIGLMVLSFGGPNKAEDVVPFLENVTRGRGIPRHRLEKVGEHYFAMGGKSPINEQNLELIANIEAELARRGADIPVYFGNRNWEPYVEDTLLRMTRDGITQVYVFATSAWGGYSGCRQYHEDVARARAAVEKAGLQPPTVERLPHFHDNPTFIAQFATAVEAAVAELPEHARETADLVFTAHSVPNVADDEAGPHKFGGNLYSQQVLDSARLIQQSTRFADRPGSAATEGWTGQLASGKKVGGRPDGPATTGVPAGIDMGSGTDLDVEMVWQSRSGSPHTPWLEPDVCDHIEARAAAGNTRAIVLCPVGFITDHMEVKWDLDTEAKEAAEEAGVPYVRTATPGLTPEFAAMVVDNLAALIRRPEVLAPSEGLSEQQEAARAIVARYGTVPNFGNTVNGSPCAPGCCGAER
ncbi:ferrochelatase [Corynebacterium heidelbergense]|uniref:Coproporphyrin III ferrochelatase n=1 Tax=Corynebacterium heidelbergense TaxID=2055947 RepID=A0A364V568_9CORY|nr:ferrochelatase [Corynebacterium heidelbergense]RAV31785.1 ferrochelatase [Corynebacterium heidelbergense]